MRAGRQQTLPHTSASLPPLKAVRSESVRQARGSNTSAGRRSGTLRYCRDVGLDGLTSCAQLTLLPFQVLHEVFEDSQLLIPPLQLCLEAIHLPLN